MLRSNLGHSTFSLVILLHTFLVTHMKNKPLEKLAIISITHGRWWWHWMDMPLDVDDDEFHNEIQNMSMLGVSTRTKSFRQKWWKYDSNDLEKVNNNIWLQVANYFKLNNGQLRDLKTTWVL